MLARKQQLEFEWQPWGLRNAVGAEFESEVEAFDDFGARSTKLRTGFLLPEVPDRELGVPVYVNEFWTARQRQANALHEISYRACFKPQLPRFFIEHLTEPWRCGL
ncbi:MAG: hypothetical protein M2R45_02611 [Verrucomicrobia subdivision 3 bacterium]|nr:hypothetical protein [Limisphaerales bacterium]MCS1416421.1 hypothetical protein [Limisphaerales bacterium]